MSWLSRLRHRRGYGIHSPWAYRFITEALHPRPGALYYAEAAMNTLLERLLYRIAVNVGATSIRVIQPPGQHHKFLNGYRRPKNSLVACPFYIVCEGAQMPTNALLTAPPYAIVLVEGTGHPQAADFLSLPHAMAFDMHQGPLVVTVDAGLPRQLFQL